jgi:hypothetical protein
MVVIDPSSATRRIGFMVDPRERDNVPGGPHQRHVPAWAEACRVWHPQRQERLRVESRRRLAG